MSVFCSKPIKKPLRLGDLLAAEREKYGWSLADIQQKCHIPLKYVAALEAGRFVDLPTAKAHRLAYIRQYAAALNLNSDECLQQFSAENGLSGVSAELKAGQRTHSLRGQSISAIARQLILASCVVLFFGYLVWQVKGIIEPPALTVLSPLDGSVVNDRTILVQGEAQAGTKLTINGQEVAGNSRGIFRIPLDLVEGLNTLSITATKKHGKTTERLVNVILKPTTFSSNP
jgi:transcriptional regulator with XRE-family HTH domain